MKPITRIIVQCFLLSFIFAVTACNNTSDPAKAKTGAEDHFLKEKLDTIKKAEAVEKLIQNTDAMQRRVIDEKSE